MAKDYATCLATNPRMVRDDKAPDGMLAAGWRLVRKGGRVKAFGIWWQDELLLPYVGTRVWMDETDYWNSECTVYAERYVPKSRICHMLLTQQK